MCAIKKKHLLDCHISLLLPFLGAKSEVFLNLCRRLKLLPLLKSPRCHFSTWQFLFLHSTFFFFLLLNLSLFFLFGSANDWTDWRMDRKRQTERERERSRDSPSLPRFPSTFPEIFYVFKSKSMFPWDIFNCCGLKECVWWDERGSNSHPTIGFIFFLLLWFGAKENRQIKLISLHQSSPPAKFFFCRGKKRKKEKRPRSRLCLCRLALCSPVVCSLAVRPCPTSCPTCHVLANATSLCACITSCFLSNSTLIYTNSQQFGHPLLV